MNPPNDHSRKRIVFLRERALLAVAFIVAVCFVFTTHAQTTQSLNDRLRQVEEKQAALDAQVKHLEASNIEHRLSTEEADLQLVLKLTYVVIGGVFLELVLQALRLRTMRAQEQAWRRLQKPIRTTWISRNGDGRPSVLSS